MFHAAAAAAISRAVRSHARFGWVLAASAQRLSKAKRSVSARKVRLCGFRGHQARPLARGKIKPLRGLPAPASGLQ